MATIASEIRDSFRYGNCITRLIYVNLAVFVSVRMAAVVLTLCHARNPTAFLAYLEMPAAWQTLLHQPWGALSYMFLHYDFIHLIFNLLALYWFGKIFLIFFNGKQLVGLYLLGGLAGAACFSALFPDGFLLGASASILAILAAAAAAAPNFEITLAFVGRVRLKYLALTWIVIDLLSVTSFNAGGHIAHLGGILFGFFYAKMLAGGHDLARPLNNVLDRAANIFRRKPKMKITKKKDVPHMTDQEYNRMRREKDARIDAILDKIKRTGYNSLTREEKELIFKQTR